MRFYLKILLVSILFSSITSSVLCQSKAAKEIEQVFRLGEEYWNKGDAEGYVSLYAPLDSSRMLLSKGAVYGKEAILAFYKKHWPKEKMGQLTTDGMVSEKLSKKFYLTTGYFHLIYPNGEKTDGRFSVIMRKIKGRWYYYMDHSS